MRSKKTVLFFILILLSFSIVAQNINKSKVIKERNNKEFYIHTVQKGQTVYSIAKAYNVSVDEIFYENPETKSGLSIGAQVWIPTVNKETEVNREVSSANYDFFYHIAKQNERFSTIAGIYSVPVKYIKLANKDLKEPLKTGEYVKIPAETAFAVLDGKQPVSSKSSTAVASTGNNQENDVSFNPNIKVMENYRHVVTYGESLESIAKNYQIKIADLKSVNPGLYSISSGDRLRIPDYAIVPGSQKKNTITTHDSLPTTVKKEQPSKSALYYRYTVQYGDNLYKIARQFAVPLEELRKANPGLKGSKLASGSILLIPKLKTNPHYIFYKPPSKTKLKRIARLFGISNKQIKRANPGMSNRVFAGQLVKIPGGEKAILLSTEPEIRISGNLETPVEKPIPTQCLPSPYKGKSYKIALMIPLFLEDLEKIDFENFHSTYKPQTRPFRFIEFLEGAYIAIDSLKKLGYNLEVNVYDVDNQITKTTKTLQQNELKNMDLIIGPFYSKSFNQVALFAENFNIPIVNPLSFREEIIGKYKNIIKVKPGAKAQIPLLTALIKKRYPNHKVFLITQNSYKDADLITKLKTALTEAVPSNIKLSNSTINDLSLEVDSRLSEDDEPVSPYYNLEGTPIDPAVIEADLYDSTSFNNRPITINYMIDSINPVINQASVIRKNLVIIYGNNKSYLMDAINHLNIIRDTFNIEIIGLPYWEQIKNMDYMLLNNLNLTYFTSEYINYSNQQTQQYISTFRDEYNAEPNSYGFSGFDITFFFVKTLVEYDHQFMKCLPSKSSITFENGFKFNKTGNKENNFENVMWNIIQIKNFKTIRLPESDYIPTEEK